MTVLPKLEQAEATFSKVDIPRRADLRPQGQVFSQ
jgi:hypothetical protein